jgi:glycerol-3-phosphate dehydrogenase
MGGHKASEATAALRDFLQERWKGIHPILYGDGLRQARLDEWIFQGLLDIEHLPATQKLEA